METLFKAGISVVVLCIIYYELLFVVRLWRSQLDPQATITGFIARLKPKHEVVVFREPNKIYQDGAVVGEVGGEVEMTETKVTFKRLINTTKLDRQQAFEYQRLKLRLSSIRSHTGQEMNFSDKGTQISVDVLGDVVCERIQ